MNLFAWYWLAVVVFGVLYVLLIVWYLIGWKSISVFNTPKKDFTTTVSILLPFYNEAPKLRQVVEQIIAQQYRGRELSLYLIDDYSSDNSWSIAQQLASEYNMVKCLKNNGEKGKKHALLRGIGDSKSELIITVDADVALAENWLSSLVSYYEKFHPAFIIAPVKISPVKGFLQNFQFMDTMSLVASGAGAAGINRPIMCNGANLAYSREKFLTLDNPFNLKYLSGDDVFLLHAFKEKYPDEIHFLKNIQAMAQLEPVKGMQAFLKQRRRWASKSKGYSDNDAKFAAIVVYFISLLTLFGGVIMWFNSSYFYPWLFAYALKTLIDIVFFNAVAVFFGANSKVKWVPLFQLVYVFYISMVGLLALLPQRKW